MKLDSQDLLLEFFEQEKDNFPNVSYSQFKDVTHGPWRHLVTAMKEGSLEVVRLKYFGTFVVHRKKAEGELRNIERKFKDGTMPEAQYLKLKEMITEYLKNLQDEED